MSTIPVVVALVPLAVAVAAVVVAALLEPWRARRNRAPLGGTAMSCEEELNALRQAERQLAEWRRRHPDTADPSIPVPPGDVAGSAAAETGDVRHLAELAAAVRSRQDAYDRCRSEAGDVNGRNRDGGGELGQAPAARAPRSATK